MQVILIGPPGVGKGTQAKLLQERFQLPHISSGDLLRAAVKRKTETGLQAKRYMDRGELVPNPLVVSIIEERVREADCQPGFILDGFPRNVAQAEALAPMLASVAKQVDHVISLIVPREEIIKRLSGRRTCRECGAMYHIIFNPPVNTGLCNKCNGELYQRDDDQEDTIVARLDVFQRETEPLLAYYRTRSLLREVDGVGSSEQVLDRILTRIPAPQ
ncbi:MAG: adenylate kinase [Deltaproteobacteria bacterium]|nr:adenylate kinase [Deltaproteobacteria bacterium]MBI3391068.1 adenylate kinase [Deltaproteobacteria bacterium]